MTDALNKKPKIIFNGIESFKDIEEAVNNTEPNSYIEHFENKAVIILLKHKISARDFLTVGKIVVPKNHYSFLKEIETLIDNIMERKQEERIKKIQLEREQGII